MPKGLTLGSPLGHLPLLILEGPPAVSVPLPRRTARLLAVIEGNASDAISLLPAEDIPVVPQESNFRAFQNTINKISESFASPLPEDMASCFNATYHKTSLAETSSERIDEKHPTCFSCQY